MILGSLSPLPLPRFHFRENIDNLTSSYPTHQLGCGRYSQPLPLPKPWSPILIHVSIPNITNALSFKIQVLSFKFQVHVPTFKKRMKKTKQKRMKKKPEKLRLYSTRVGSKSISISTDSLKAYRLHENTADQIPWNQKNSGRKGNTVWSTDK